MENVFTDIGPMLSVVAVVMVIVLLAMVIDLLSGINKARQNGKMRTSWGLKRTVSKFIMYEGSLLIAAGVDVLLHASHLYDLLHLDAIRGVPFVTCLVGVFICMVEFMSVHETADTKTKKEWAETARLIGQVVARDELVDVIKDAIKASQAQDHEGERPTY